MLVEDAVKGKGIRRFRRLRRVCLTHPNIAHVYEIGEEGEANFLVMEFVDGETLRTKIHRDKTELSKLLPYLAQIADGLAKAHSVGIVHLDLKPDNIMISREGYAKILDFGLAKLLRPEPSPASISEDVSDVPTVMLPHHSVPGAVMGTVGYISPEQARGSNVDHRSDIFSFDCILYAALLLGMSVVPSTTPSMPDSMLTTTATRSLTAWARSDETHIGVIGC